ncbi:sugar ABC transporter ATP-binding protein [Streptomyces sp. NPDC002928]|uniref:sugar ABC transporter ATP-binding protein n=1 Tax=Streptomyces sp. NPDC002928 TaxID=3154440 RepID=UPI0033BA6C1C
MAPHSSSTAEPAPGMRTGGSGGEAPDTRPAALRVRNVSKTFGGTRVLSGFDFDVQPGEVHALVGQNGSGKSTFLKILSGYQPCDRGGETELGGRPLTGHGPRPRGMAFVHQDLGLVEAATVLENLVAGTPRGRGRLISWKHERQRARESMARLGLSLDPDALVAGLHPVDRAMLALVRATDELRGVSDGVLVLDEPTAYLPRDGIERLLEMIRQLAREGLAVVFVTHHLDEVLAVADRLSVLRDGHLVGRSAVAGLTEDDIVEMMIGTQLDGQYPLVERTLGAPVLEVRGMRTGDGVEDGGEAGTGAFDLELRAGEIVGVTGLVGSGWEEIPYQLFGAATGTIGTIRVAGREYDLRQMNPRRSAAAGMALLPANRVRDSAVAELTVTDNMTVASLRKHRTALGVGIRSRRTAAERDIALYDVRPANPDALLGTLSGGNQQKALLAKWFATDPRVMLLHEPTQGVDVGARRQILEQIQLAAARGIGVLLVSAEHKDLAHMCDRVLVFRGGRVAEELHGDRLSEHVVLSAAATGDHTAA